MKPETRRPFKESKETLEASPDGPFKRDANASLRQGHLVVVGHLMVPKESIAPTKVFK